MSNKLRMPTWYRRFCERQSKAAWGKQITAREATIALRVFHFVAIGEALNRQAGE